MSKPELPLSPIKTWKQRQFWIKLAWILIQPKNDKFYLQHTCTHVCHTWSGLLSSSLEVIVKYNATWAMLLRSGLEGAGASPLINLMRWLSFLGGVWWRMTGEDILGWTSLCIARVIWKNFCKRYFLSLSFNREGIGTTKLTYRYLMSMQTLFPPPRNRCRITLN